MDLPGEDAGFSHWPVIFPPSRPSTPDSVPSPVWKYALVFTLGHVQCGSLCSSWLPCTLFTCLGSPLTTQSVWFLWLPPPTRQHDFNMKHTHPKAAENDWSLSPCLCSGEPGKAWRASHPALLAWSVRRAQRMGLGSYLRPLEAMVLSFFLKKPK